MNIQQQPDALSLSGNMKEIILSGVADSEVVFRLFTPASETPILERKYAPDSAGVINIDIHRFIDDRQSFLMSSSTSPWQQPNLACTYYFTVVDQTSDNFTVVRGGVAQLADTAANWLTQNFLTWQPTTKKVTYATPEMLTYYAQQACNVIIKVYYPDGTSEVLTGISLTAGAWTIPVSFATVAAMVVNLPGAYDVWIEDGQGNHLTYVQRYIADSMREDEQWILFENSLGGVDVFRAYGKGTMEASHEHQIAESDDNLDEYRVDLKRQYRRSTGWMDKNQRRWMLDFFPARRRWILQDGVMLPIVLTEDTTSYTMDNMPAEFEFTFRYASAKPYLNIPRVEVPAAVMDITAPDMQSFTIPPRLVEFPRISPSEGGLIPIQHPYSEKWSTLSLEELLSIIAGAIEEATEDLDGRFAVDSQYYLWVRQVIGGVPTLHKIKAESADMWDGHQFGNYLDQPVRKEDDVEFKSVKSKRLEIGRFASGLLGSGALLDENGNLEVESIFSRSFISSPEFRFNRVNVTEGEDWCTNGFGVIKKVDIIDATSGYITLKLEENDYASVEVGDICRGIYNDITGRYQTADLDDDSELYGSAGESGDFGFPSKSGYFTSYFFVMDMEGTGCYNNRGECRFKYGLRNASTPHPCAFMKFAQYGNFDINSGRCSSSYESSMGKHYKMSLHGVTTWKISSANITTREDWLGDLYVTFNDGRQVQLQGYGLYVQDNVYFGNAVIQLDPYTLAQLQEELANYQVDFSDYVDVITVDDVGNVIGGLYTQEGQVKNYRIHSAITVKRGSDVLLLANDEDDAGPGTYKISVLPHGCSCIVRNSTLYITGITNVCDGVSATPNDFDYDAMRAVESCSVDVTIDCEGKGSVVRKFPITIRHDSQPFVGADIDNEFSAVSWNTKTQAYIGLPIVLDMKMWHNNEQLDIASADDVSVSPAVTGMTVSKEIITVSGQKHARVTISALPASLSNVTKLSITAVSTYAGVRYERTLTHTINKGTDVNVYSLKPSLDEIILNKNTGALSSSSLTCKVMCDSSDDKHYEVTLADLATHKLKLCYQIHYNDGTATTAETDYTAAGVTGLTNAVDKVVFKLYNLDKSVQYDEEGIPVIASGQDGKGVEYVFVLTTTNTAPTITSNADWTETVDGETVTHHVTDDDFRPMTSAGRATDEPTGTDSTNIFEWVAKRVKRFNNDGVLEWEPYDGTMSLWANWSKDGGTPETRYQWNQSPTSAPPLDAQNPSATTPDSNWNVSVPNRPGDGYYLWSVTAIKNYNNTYGTWGNFVRLTGDTGTPGEDGDEKEWIYGYSENGYAGNTGQVNPSGEASGSETNKNQPGWVPNGWTDHPRGVSNSHKTEYASWRNITNNGTTKSYGAFHTPIIWSHYGERGTDGDGTEYVFIRTKINTAPEVPSSGDYSEEENDYDSDEHLPYVFIFNEADISGSTTPVTPSGSAVKYVKCTDDPVGVNDEWKYEWVLKRSKAAPVGGVRSWEPYSGEMSLWAKYGDKGDPAHEIDINMLERTNFDRGLDAIKEAWVVTRDVWSKITVDSTLKVKGRSCVKIDGTDATDNSFDFEQSVLGKLKANTKYTLSFWGCNTTTNRLQVFIFGDAYGTGSKLYQGKFLVDGIEVIPEDNNGCVMFGAAATPVYHTITFKTASTIPARAEIWFRADQGTISYICMPKLEEGDTATAYIADEGDLIGPQGTSITGANVMYALADSGSTVPADSAFTLDSFPTTLNSGKYVWEATKITFSSGSPVFTGKMCLGPTTDFLTGTEVYAISTSNSTAPADNQFGTTYNKTKGYYLWTATRVQYTSGTYAYLNKKCVGYWGDDGVSPYQLKLSDEAALINCDEDGNVISGFSYEISRLMIQQGVNSKFTDFNISIIPIGISCNGHSSQYSLDEATKESADSTGYYSMVPSAITVDAAEIRVIATLKTDSNYVLTAGYKINKNKAGTTGKTGPSYYPAGEYDANTNNAFSRTDEMCPVVLFENNYYYLKQDSNLKDGNRIPPTGNEFSSNYWALASNFQVVFIKALFAAFASLGSFIVNKDWFISQYGTLIGPNDSVSIDSSNVGTLYGLEEGEITANPQSDGRVGYAWFDDSDPECETAFTNVHPIRFVPILAIDAKTGKIFGSNVKLSGDIHAKSGRFAGTIQLATGGEWGQALADANIFYLPARKTMGGIYPMPCGEEHIGKVIRFYNSSTNAGGKYEIFGTKFEVPAPQASEYPWTGFSDDIILEAGGFVEFTCFEKFDGTANVRKAEWRITNKRHKSKSGFLAAGTITVDSTSNITMNGKGLDGVTATKLGEGRIELSFTDGLF